VKPHLRRKRKALSGMQVLLEIAGHEETMESVRAGTQSESWRVRVPNSWKFDTETVVY